MIREEHKVSSINQWMSARNPAKTRDWKQGNWNNWKYLVCLQYFWAKTKRHSIMIKHAKTQIIYTFKISANLNRPQKKCISNLEIVKKKIILFYIYERSFLKCQNFQRKLQNCNHSAFFAKNCAHFSIDFTRSSTALQNHCIGCMVVCLCTPGHDYIQP